jgi:hypothetical protein
MKAARATVTEKTSGNTKGEKETQATAEDLRMF